MPTYGEYYQADPRDKAAEALVIIDEIRQAHYMLFDKPLPNSGIDVVEAKYLQILKGYNE